MRNPPSVHQKRRDRHVQFGVIAFKSDQAVPHVFLKRAWVFVQVYGIDVHKFFVASTPSLANSGTH